MSFKLNLVLIEFAIKCGFQSFSLTMERKYGKVKKMLREFQQRDRDMVRFIESIDFNGNNFSKCICHFLDSIPRVLLATLTRERHRIQCIGEKVKRSCYKFGTRVARYPKACWFARFIAIR